MNGSHSTSDSPPFLQLCDHQEWNEIQFNGVHWEPEEKGAPGEVHPDKSYTFKHPRPPRQVKRIAADIRMQCVPEKESIKSQRHRPLTLSVLLCLATSLPPPSLPQATCPADL